MVVICVVLKDRGQLGSMLLTAPRHGPQVGLAQVPVLLS